MSDFGPKLHPEPQPIGKPQWRVYFVRSGKKIKRKRRRVQLVRVWSETIRPMVSRERDEVVGWVRYVGWSVKEIDVMKEKTKKIADWLFGKPWCTDSEEDCARLARAFVDKFAPHCDPRAIAREIYGLPYCVDAEEDAKALAKRLTKHVR